MPNDEVNNFAQSIVNIYRLNALKGNVAKAVKKMRKPTPKDSGSKKSVKAVERVRIIKKKKADAKKEKRVKRERKQFLIDLAKGKRNVK